ncbi:MAG: hypothetical protein QHH18_00420 [Candidatus Bathyarchaeota archaeon]|jgi:hypothetical protein|nr:hypothetical protein [Candidatus Bathyarchaeota archaeon A05DMB-5]MDH7557058.1 hypothetical protein [Candidatus Bathyarchaeota archaeon]
MSKPVKKKISSMSFSLNRLYKKLSATKPSTLIISVLIMGFAVFLFGGGIYNIVMRPLPSYYGGSGVGFILLYPRLSEQFIYDSVIAIALYSLGAAGLIVMYQSTKYAYKPRQAYMMFLAGIILLLITYIFLESVIRLKLG